MVKRAKKADANTSAKVSGSFRSDARHIRLLKRVMKEAVAEAININKALDLPITYLKGDQIVREYNDGQIEIIGSLGETVTPPIFTGVKKGDVIDLTK
jgi:hypothetical protein